MTIDEEGAEAALRALAELAGALSTVDPSRKQIVLPASTHAAEDVSALNPAERAAARYRALVEQLPAVTFVAALDEGANEMYVSPQIEALLGYSQKEWLDDPVLWFSRLHPDDRDLWNLEFARGVASGGPFRAQCRVIARDGRVVWIHGEARLVRDDAGRPLFLQGIAFDITESKRAEQQIREAQAQKLRSERLAAIGQLAASVGHDLRNPISAARTAHYFVNRRVLASELAQDPRVVQQLKIMEEELTACNRIITELLDFARERPLRRTVCILKVLVTSALGVVQAPSHVKLHNELTDSLPTVDIDRDQMRQVLVNLMQNAAEAIPQDRQGLVRVRAELAPDGQTVLLSVTDNGAGISDEYMQRMFEPFFTTKNRGTGLGLAIVNNIITRHEGKLTVQTKRDVGTTFTIHLPIASKPA